MISRTKPARSGTHRNPTPIGLGQDTSDWGPKSKPEPQSPEHDRHVFPALAYGGDVGNNDISEGADARGTKPLHGTTSYKWCKSRDDDIGEVKS